MRLSLGQLLGLSRWLVDRHIIQRDISIWLWKGDPERGNNPSPDMSLIAGDGYLALRLATQGAGFAKSF